MTPQTITILTIPMIIVSFVYNCGHLTTSPWAFLCKGGATDFGNITHHEFFYHRA